MNASYDECDLSMDEKVKAILTQEVIDTAIEDYWRKAPRNWCRNPLGVV